MATARHLSIILTAGFLATTTNPYLAVAADLDTPLVKKTPTVRTELMRGRDVAAECAAILELGAREGCLMKIEMSLRLKNELNEPFELGFNFAGFLHFDSVYRVLAKMNRLSSADVDYANRVQPRRRGRIKELQITLNLSDDELCEALVLQRGQENCRQLLARWSVPVR